jgi:imidazolonepropionase-like amidohydrolase
MRRRSCRAVAAALLSAAMPGSLPAQGPDRSTDAPPAAAAGGAFAVRCGRVHVGDGRTLDDVWLVVRDGKIAEVGARDAAPADLPVIDARGRVVVPGLVAADSDLSGHQDQVHQVTPDLVAVDGFDFATAHKRALSGGVTTVYLSPGRARLIPGQGSVVKTAGASPEDRLLAESCCLRITLGKESTNAPLLYEPPASPTADDPLPASTRQLPTARLSQLAELRRLFAQAQELPAGNGARIADGGFAEDDWHVAPLQLVTRGELPLRVAAREAQDIQRALLLAEGFRARIVLEGPEQVDRVAAKAKALGAIAVFRMPVRPGAPNPGGEDARDRTLWATPDAPARAAAAGIPVALAAQHDADLRDLLLVAALAVRYGLSQEQALRAVTLDAARALGVETRVGSLQAGKDADFLILSGEPFAVGTLVEQAFVDGRRAFQRERPGRLLALRVGRALPVDGAPIERATILIEDGRIKAIGQDLAVPHGAEIVDVPGGVATPGFVDAYAHAGLSGDGAPVPQGAPDQDVARAVRTEDRWLREAAGAGLTTRLVSGKDGALVSGRVAAVKTGGGDAVLKPTAALRFVHDSLGDTAIQQLAGAIERGRQYIESWQRYEKALADWKAGKAEKPKDAPAEPPAEDPLSGTWEIELQDLPVPVPLKLIAVLKLDGTKVTGTVTTVFNERRGQAQPIENATFENGTLTIELRGGPGGTGKVTARVENDVMTGTFDGGQLRGSLTGRRTSKDAGAAAAAAASGEPVKPRVDESLEPVRALLEKKIPAVVRCSKGGAIADVVKWFEQQKLPYVLHGAEDALYEPAVLGDKRPPVVLGPDVLREQDAETINAPAKLCELGCPVALGTGDTAGARWLPVHAGLAVRYGMDPQEALAALTLNPARMFRLDDRIGSLARGKDADVVVFSGSPFELTSRVLLVLVDGRIAVDRRKEDVK